MNMLERKSKRPGALLPAPEEKDPRWQAIAARDKSWDGKIYCAVATTGIVCRPACPARMPLRHNVRLFADLKAALAAGFRPCKRCRPAG